MRHQFSSPARLREEFFTHRQPELDKRARFDFFYDKFHEAPYNSNEEQEVEKYQTNIQKAVLHV